MVLINFSENFTTFLTYDLHETETLQSWCLACLLVFTEPIWNSTEHQLGDTNYVPWEYVLYDCMLSVLWHVLGMKYSKSLTLYTIVYSLLLFLLPCTCTREFVEIASGNLNNVMCLNSLLLPYQIRFGTCFSIFKDVILGKTHPISGLKNGLILQNCAKLI